MDIKRECEILKETQFSGVEKSKMESQTLEGISLSFFETTIMKFISNLMSLSQQLPVWGRLEVIFIGFLHI